MWESPTRMTVPQGQRGPESAQGQFSFPCREASRENRINQGRRREPSVFFFPKNLPHQSLLPSPGADPGGRAPPARGDAEVVQPLLSPCRSTPLMETSPATFIMKYLNRLTIFPDEQWTLSLAASQWAAYSCPELPAPFSCQLCNFTLCLLISSAREMLPLLFWGHISMHTFKKQLQDER